MCLILFSYKSHPKYRLVAAANRDEFYNRPTQPLSFWNQNTGILAGRDLECNGTWLGMTTTGRFAAITNYREREGEPDRKNTSAPSRGLLVSEFLSGTLDPDRYLSDVHRNAHLYNGFNLLIGDRSALYYYSNRGDGIVALNPGIYGLSNHLMNTPWPKVEKGRGLFQEVLEESESTTDPGKLLDILNDRTLPPDHMLPDTGVGIEWERILSPVFITNDNYGTRSSSVIWMEYSGKVTFLERSYDPKKEGETGSETRMFTFQINS